MDRGPKRGLRVIEVDDNNQVTYSCTLRIDMKQGLKQQNEKQYKQFLNSTTYLDKIRK